MAWVVSRKNWIRRKYAQNPKMKAPKKEVLGTLFTKMTSRVAETTVASCAVFSPVRAPGSNVYVCVGGHTDERAAHFASLPTPLTINYKRQIR